MHLKKIKRILLSILLLFCAGGIGFDVYQTYQNEKSERQTQSKEIWLSDVPAPETIRPGAYLAAINAVFNQNLEKAADLYLSAEEGDPLNKKLQQESYFFNAMMGQFDKLKPIVNRITAEEKSGYLTEYVQSAYAVKEKRWSDIRTIIKPVKEMGFEKILNPLLRGWSYVGEGNFESALNELKVLQEDESLKQYYLYHKGLMALALNLELEADSAFKELANKDLLTVSLYPEIKMYYLRQGQWNINNPMYVKWQLFDAQQAAAAELIMQAVPQFVTPIRGMAEAFYNVSTLLGGAKNNNEPALILSALSLYLNPNQELPKIWSAELLEDAQKPELATHYYEQLVEPVTQTVAFKKANNLIKVKQLDKAVKILNELKKTNAQSTPLWGALAIVYQQQENWPAAIHAYTQILKIEGETNREYAANIYFSRALIYGEQKKFDKAESDLTRALELNPDNPVLLNHLGYQWLEKDSTLDKGVELVEKAYNLKSFDPHIIDSMAYAYYRKKNYQKALPLAEKTVDLMPQSSVANAHLGDIYAALGRTRESRFQYNKALALTYDLTPELKQELTQKLMGNSAK